MSVETLIRELQSIVIRGEGNPNGRVVSPPGVIYLDKNGGTNLTQWVKEQGTGASGWVPK